MKRRTRAYIFSALSIAVLGAVVALSVGKVFISPFEYLSNESVVSNIVWILRAPRAVAALFIGASLAVSGLLLQSYFRNPLADPYILGVSSGAALGAVVKLVLTPSIPVPLPLCAAAGGALAVICAWLIARGTRGDVTISLLLSGVALSILAGSLLSVLIIWSKPGDLGLVMRWLMGTLAGAGWNEVAWMIGGFGLCYLVALRFSRELNAVQLGSVVAESIGVNMRWVQVWTIGIATLLASLAVSAAGLIGFIGLIVPHTCRMLVGGDVRRLLPLTAAFGAAVLVWCDTLTRTALTSGELPIGAVTAILGVPFFLWLMKRGRLIG